MKVALVIASLKGGGAGKDERQRLAANAPKVVERLGIEEVMGLWEQHVAWLDVGAKRRWQ